MVEVELPKPDEIREQASDAFNRKVALITALYAVMLAITSLGGNNAMKEMLVEQQQSSNQWAYYQAKVIRENIYKVEAQELELELKVRGKGYDAEQRREVEKLRKSFSDKAKEYGGEKQVIFDQAKSHEKKRDLSQQKDPYFDYAEVLLQIAIVLASISMLAHNRNVFFISVAFAVLGVFLSYDGFAVGTKGYIPVPIMEADVPEEASALLKISPSRPEHLEHFGPAVRPSTEVDA